MSYLAQERGGVGKPIGAFCDYMAHCEVTRVLLLMLLQVDIFYRVVWRHFGEGSAFCLSAYANFITCSKFYYFEHKHYLENLKPASKWNL